MLAENTSTHLSPGQVEAMLRNVVSRHLTKLERIALAAKSAPGFASRFVDVAAVTPRHESHDRKASAAAARASSPIGTNRFNRKVRNVLIRVSPGEVAIPQAGYTALSMPYRKAIVFQPISIFATLGSLEMCKEVRRLGTLPARLTS